MLPFLAALALSVALLLVSAKAHGRQVRMERELEGHHEVVFGGENPPFVMALWRRDRRAYWTLVPLVALAAGGLVLWLRAGLGWTLVAVLLWAPTVGFSALGLVSLARLQTRMREKAAPSAWRRGAARGSAFWWGAAGLLALAVALAAVLAALA